MLGENGSPPIYSKTMLVNSGNFEKEE